MDKITLVLKQRIYAMLPFVVCHTLRTRKSDPLQLVRAMVPTYMASALLEEGPTSGPFSPPKTYLERLAIPLPIIPKKDTNGCPSAHVNLTDPVNRVGP